MHWSTEYSNAASRARLEFPAAAGEARQDWWISATRSLRRCSVSASAFAGDKALSNLLRMQSRCRPSFLKLTATRDFDIGAFLTRLESRYCKEEGEPVRVGPALLAGAARNGRPSSRSGGPDSSPMAWRRSLQISSRAL